MAKFAQAIRLLLFACSVLAASPSGAATVTVMFSGTLDRVNDPSGLSGGSIGVGTMFSGTLRFSDMASDEWPSPQIGIFRFPGATGSLSIGAGSFTQSSGNGGITIWTDKMPTAPGASTSLIVLVPSTRQPGPTRDETFFFDLGFVAMLPSDALVGFPFDIARFPSARAGFAVMGQGPNNTAVSFNVSGPVTRLQVAAVPEPSALAMLGLGLAALGLRRRRARA